MYSGKFEAIHEGVVQAMRLIQGLTTESFPLILVLFSNVPCLLSHRLTRRSTMSLLLGSRRLPNSEDSMVMALIDWNSPLPRSNISVASEKAVTRACQVTTSGPNFTPGTRRSNFIPIEAVVDLLTIPGGATSIM